MTTEGSRNAVPLFFSTTSNEQGNAMTKTYTACRGANHLSRLDCEGSGSGFTGRGQLRVREAENRAYRAARFKLFGVRVAMEQPFGLNYAEAP